MRIKFAKFLTQAAAVAVLFSGMATATPAQESVESVPLLLSAEMPVYPMIARAAHVEGIVKIKVKTNGNTVEIIDVISGPAMLVDSAKKNIQSWKFLKHSPTTFVTTFSYELVSPALCDYTNAIATIHLPTEVRISANSIQTCDPAVAVQKVKH